VNNYLYSTISKVANSKRINTTEAMFLYNNASISLLGILATLVKTKKNSDYVYFVRNYHIEPTNKCIYKCKFCSFCATNEENSWSKSAEQILDEVKNLPNDINELHIVGGSDENYDLNFYSNLFTKIKGIKPNLHIKAFTASEINFLAELEEITIKQCLLILKQSGLDSMPGGGAEIFNKKIRSILCQSKINAKKWLEIHNIAHQLNISTNASMLYGHIEKTKDRISHLNELRKQQDISKGFKTFVPLKFKNKNNSLSNIIESSILEDLKVFAISRIFLDNFDHIKVYWPAYGKSFAQLSLEFGVDDIDGTISNSTKIYSMAGASEQTPFMTIEEAKQMISEVGLKSVERDALYKHLN